jgi:hypothetical protein
LFDKLEETQLSKGSELVPLAEKSFKWFDAFAGIGYYFHDVRPLLLLVFEKRNELFYSWKKVLKWWPEDDMRIRFVETNDSYKFIMYCESLVPDTDTVFLKFLNMSENYKKFKVEYEGAANLGLAIRRKSHEDKFELEIFKYRKRIANLRFLNEGEDDDKVVASSGEIFRRISGK